jgi:hypothetical protein
MLLDKLVFGTSQLFLQISKISRKQIYMDSGKLIANGQQLALMLDLSGTLDNLNLIDFGYARFLNQEPAKPNLKQLNPFFIWR